MCVGTNNTQTFGIAEGQAVWLFGLLLAMIRKLIFYWVLLVQLTTDKLLYTGMRAKYHEFIQLGFAWGLVCAFLPMVLVNE